MKDLNEAFWDHFYPRGFFILLKDNASKDWKHKDMRSIEVSVLLIG